MTSHRASLPDITHHDVDIVLVSQWTVDTPERQQAVAEATITAWERAPWPDGCISLACFVNIEGDIVLTYSQWTSDEACREFVRTNRPALINSIEETIPDIELTDPIEYRLYRSGVSDSERGDPECIVVVSFDTDDSEQQRQFVDSMFDISPDLPPDCLSAHFHFSTDGTRILNYAEWTDEAAHREMIEKDTSADDNEVHQLIDNMPGVRPMGFKRYNLHRSLLRR